MELRRREIWRERGVQMWYLVSFAPDVSCLTLIPLCSDTVSHVFQAHLDNLNNSNVCYLISFWSNWSDCPLKNIKNTMGR